MHDSDANLPQVRAVSGGAAEIYAPPRRPVRIGPPPDAGAMCYCNRRAEAKCEGCGKNFCARHWWRHSHGGPSFDNPEIQRLYDARRKGAAK